MRMRSTASAPPRRRKSRLTQIDAMLDDSIRDALALVNTGNGSAPHSE